MYPWTLPRSHFLVLATALRVAHYNPRVSFNHNCWHQAPSVTIVKERQHFQSFPNTSLVEQDEIRLTTQKQLFLQRDVSNRTYKRRLDHSSQPLTSSKWEICPEGSDKQRSPKAPLHLEQVLVWLGCCMFEVLWPGHRDLWSRRWFLAHLQGKTGPTTWSACSVWSSGGDGNDEALERSSTLCSLLGLLRLPSKDKAWKC